MASSWPAPSCGCRRCVQVGFKVWEQDQNVFACWDSIWDVIWHGELGSSLAILNAGEVGEAGEASRCPPVLWSKIRVFCSPVETLIPSQGAIMGAWSSWPATRRWWQRPT